MRIVFRRIRHNNTAITTTLIFTTHHREWEALVQRKLFDPRNVNNSFSRA